MNIKDNQTEKAKKKTIIFFCWVGKVKLFYLCKDKSERFLNFWSTSILDSWSERFYWNPHQLILVHNSFKKSLHESVNEATNIHDQSVHLLCITEGKLRTSQNELWSSDQAQMGNSHKAKAAEKPSDDQARVDSDWWRFHDSVVLSQSISDSVP